jgi:hypothetical protein
MSEVKLIDSRSLFLLLSVVWVLPRGMGQPVGSASWGLEGWEWSRGDGVLLLALYTGIISGNRRS